MTMVDKVRQRVIVFGGSSGIGRAVAEALLDRGAAIAVVSNDPPAMANLPDGIHRFVADVADPAQVQAAADAAAAALGGLNAMVYSAGIQRYGNVVETSEADWARVMTVNLTGAYLAAKFCVPHLRSGGGAIVNVSSVQGIACQQGVAAYAASKGGLNALTRAIALDHAAEGIRANVVLPGSVDTPMLRASADLFRGARSRDAVLAEWGESHAVGRIAAPHEVAAAIMFLLSDEASFVTGAEFRVDGGLTAALAVRAER